MSMIWLHNLKQKFLRIISWPDFRSLDITTQAGRASERSRRILFSALSSVSASGISFIVSVISVPLIFHYLGTEQYGLWVALSAIINLFTFVDFGIGNGLINAVAESRDKDDQTIVRHISSAVALLLIITFFCIVIYIVVYPIVDWHNILKLSSSTMLESATRAFTLLFILFILNMFLGIVQKVQSGIQQGYLNGLWRNIGSVLAIIFLYLAINLQRDLPSLILAYFGAPVLALAFNFMYFFGYSHPKLRPSREKVDIQSVKYLLRLGSLYFVLQAAGAIGFQTDIVIIARFLGSIEVANYSVPSRLFSFVPLIVGLVVSHLWPAFSEAASRKDHEWIQVTLRKSLRITLVFCSITLLLLAIFGNQIIHRWIGPQITVSPFLIFSLALWNLIYSISMVFAIYFNGLGIIKFQIVVATLMAIVNVGLSILLVSKIGAPGVVWGSIISYIFCVLIPYQIYIKNNTQRKGD